MLDKVIEEVRLLEVASLADTWGIGAMSILHTCEVGYWAFLLCWVDQASTTPMVGLLIGTTSLENSTKRIAYN